MPRSGLEARHRLQLAALELFERNGYEETTTAQIADRAGLTERTYFRHFSDKREVLFDGEEALRNALAKSVKEAPGASRPIDALLFALKSVAPLIEEGRAFSEPRRSIIARTPALQERLSAKTARLVATLSEAFQGRSMPLPAATMVAEIGVAILHSAAHGWLDDATTTLADHIDRAFKDIRELF